MKILNRLTRIKIFERYQPNLYKNINNYVRQYFSLSLSFKNKMNSFFKYVHPDVLGREAPEDYRKINEKSIQEINSYLNYLNSETNLYEKKTLYFYIRIEKNVGKDKSHELYEKISIELENLKPEMSQSNKYAIQSK